MKDKVTGEEMTISIVSHLSREITEIKKYLFGKMRYIENTNQLDETIDSICVSMRDNFSEWKMYPSLNMYVNHSKSVSVAINKSIFGKEYIILEPTKTKLSKAQSERLKLGIYQLISKQLHPQQ